MILTFGKHRDKTIDHILFSNPAYIQWMITHPQPAGRLITAQQAARKAVTTFDSQPFTSPCSGRDCENTATGVIVTREPTIMLPSCPSCIPFLCYDGIRFTKFQDAMNYVDKAWPFEKRNDIKKRMIEAMAKAKGLLP